MIKLWLSVCVLVAAQVPIQCVGAEAQAARGVQLGEATRRAARIEELRSKAPKAKNMAENVVADIDEGINTIDWLLRNPNRRLINGSIEGNLPRFLQYGARADAQAAFDKIKAQAAISLINNALIQTGTMPKFDAELKSIRASLYDTRVSVISLYNYEYADLIAGNPSLRLNPPPIADRFIRGQDLREKRTPVKAGDGWGEARVVGN